MGSMQAAEFAEMVGEGQVSLEAAVTWHLQSNHYPPHPHYMIPVALLAIGLASQGLDEVLIILPDGVSHARYGQEVPVYEVIEGLHLAEFVTPQKVTVIDAQAHDPVQIPLLPEGDE